MIHYLPIGNLCSFKPSFNGSQLLRRHRYKGKVTKPPTLVEDITRLRIMDTFCQKIRMRQVSVVVIVKLNYC